MMVGFQFDLASHSGEGLILSTVPSNVNLFIGCACPSLSSPNRCLQLLIFMLVKINMPLLDTV